MKSKAILVISVLLNVALAGAVVYLSSRRPPTEQTAASAPAQTPATPKPEAMPAPAALTVITNQSGQTLDWRMVESEDYRKYIANLRAIGCPEETIRDIITADVNKLFDQRRREMTASTNKFQFWKAGNPFSSAIDPDRIEKMQALNKEKRALLKELLGVEPEEKPDFLAGFNPFETMLDFLPASKQNQLMDVYMKFQAKQAKLFEGGQPDAEDMKKMRQLQKDMDVEMAGMLSPQEYEEYQLRMSQTAMSMRMQLASFDPQEQEFRSIFQLRKKFDDDYGMSGMGNASKEDRDKMNAAQKEMNAQVKGLLGDTRYAEYERAQDYAYQSIYRVTERNGLPKDSAIKVYDMKKVAEDQAKAVRSDKSLTPEQRQEALKGIRAETENAARTVLGDKAWSSYQDQRGNNWLRGISPDQKTESKTP